VTGAGGEKVETGAGIGSVWVCGCTSGHAAPSTQPTSRELHKVPVEGIIHGVSCSDIKKLRAAYATLSVFDQPHFAGFIDFLPPALLDLADFFAMGNLLSGYLVGQTFIASLIYLRRPAMTRLKIVQYGRSLYSDFINIPHDHK
jgi:hypothetical protein